MIGSVAFQAGSGTGIVSGAVGYFAPVIEAIMAFLGVAFWVSLVFLIYYGIEAYIHPTPFGRSARLASMYDHAKGIIWSIIGIYLTLAVIAFAVNQASAAAGAGTTVNVGQLFYYVFVKPVVDGFSILFGATK
jgi:uncharacterized membrane protein YozB (DUF420 family)